MRRENVQAYPRPPVVEPAGARIEVILGGRTIVSTERAFRVLETHHAPSYYIPLADVTGARLEPARGKSFCEWKGMARYYDVVAGDRVAGRGAWAYPRPTRGYSEIADCVAFYAGAVEAAFVNGMAVRPQPGSFYGGWVTDNLDGIVKGGPGTEGW